MEDNKDVLTRQAMPVAVAYVPNNGSDTVSVVNIFNDGTAQKLPVDIPVGRGPFAVDITPDGNFAYVSNNGDSTVSVIDTTSNQVVSTINLNAGSFLADGPEGIKVTPDGNFVYVVSFNSGSVSIIDTSINQVIKDFDLITSVAFIDFTPDGIQAYITAPITNEVIVINLVVNLPVKTLDNVGERPEGIFISKDPDIPIALVAAQRTNALTPIDTRLASTDRFLIDTSGKRPTGVIIVNLQNRETGLVPAAYVTNRDSNNVAVINLFLNPEMITPTPIMVGRAPQGIDSTINGKFVVVANSGDGTVSVINTDSNIVSATVKVGLTPLWLAVLDTRRPLLV